MLFVLHMLTLTFLANDQLMEESHIGAGVHRQRSVSGTKRVLLKMLNV